MSVIVLELTKIPPVGYDSGIVGGVLTMAPFKRDYRFTEDNSSHISSLAVSLQQLGAFVACFL